MITRTGESNIHIVVNAVEQRSCDMCRMIINFRNWKQLFDAVCVDSVEFDLIGHANIIVIVFSNNLLRSTHGTAILTKANKRTNVPTSDIISFLLYLLQTWLGILFTFDGKSCTS